MLTSSELRELVRKAEVAADAAGTEWMVRAHPRYAVYNADLITGAPYGPVLETMLDICGNAHVRFRDKRTKHYKQFLEADIVRKTGSGVVELSYIWQGRQEHGLKMVCAQAAKKVLEDGGITGLVIWDYID